MARLFIDQLIVLRSKTRGNLNSEELGVLNNAISNLQLVFVEVSKGAPASSGNGDAGTGEPATPPAAEPAPAPAPEASTPPASEEESRKKFTKSYGS
jgi:hypothetical protein